MAFWSRKCGKCRTKLNGETKFCPGCGEPVADIYRRCIKKDCDAIVSLTDPFCNQCGAAQPEFDGEVEFDIVWDQAEGEIASRFMIDTESQMVLGRITVREGTQALFLGDGGLRKILEPGSHPVETTLRDLQVGAEGPRRIEALFFDVSEMPLLYEFDDVPAKDGLSCSLSVRMVVEVRKAERLLTSLMRTAPSLDDEDLRQRVLGEVRNAVEQTAATWTAREITGARSGKEELAGIVKNHMRQTFEGLGFLLVRVETLSATIPDLKEVREHRKERALRGYRDEEEAELAEQNLAWHRRKAAAWKGIRKHLQEEEIEKIEDEYSLRDFLRKANREQKEKDVISESELEELADGVEFKEGDRKRARAFLLKKLDLMHEIEMERTRTRESARTLLEAADLRIERERKDLEQRLAERKSLAEIEDFEVGLELERARKKADLEQDVKDREAERKTRDRQSRVDAYGQMKKAKAESRATELAAAKDLGADQIAAMMAEREPKLADALKASFEAAAANAEERADLERRHAGELKEIFEASRDQNADLLGSLVNKLTDAVGAAVYSRASSGDRVAKAVQGTVNRTGGRPETPTSAKSCSKCKTELRPSDRFCKKCGKGVK